MAKEQKLQEIHEEALRQFDDIQSVMGDERQQCLNDRRFYSIAGAQWEGDLEEQFENKPRFEVNKIHLSVIRVINEWRNNKITVDFVSEDDALDKDLADICDGLYRADEQESVADEAYDNAFEEAVGGGFGAWRLRADYEDEYDEDNDSQHICIEPIFDADTSVYFDLNAKRQDKADAKHCFVMTSMTAQSYKDEYDDDPASWQKDVYGSEFDWATPDVVYVAEYYRVEDKSETLRIFADIDGNETKYSESDFVDTDLEEELAAIGSKEVRTRKVKRRKVHKYILSGSKVLDDCGYIAGSNIPIVPMYGKRWFIDNVERCMGHVRLAKDAQRLKNMQLSKMGELAALSAVEKPIVTPDQIAGHEMMWSEDNVKNNPYLLMNPMEDMEGNIVASGPIGYTKPPAIPPAMAALLQITEQDMMDLLGNQQAGEEIQSNISGKAVELIQNRLDMQSFIYMSNMAKAMKRSGEIWLSMAKDVFVEPRRKVRILGKQKESNMIELQTPSLSEDGEIVYKNDLSKARFKVVSDVGPTSSSKRAATVRALTGMMTMTGDPETMQVLSAMALMNMEGEGIEDARGYFRKKLVRMGVIEPTEEEKKQLEAEAAMRKPDPQAQYLEAEAQNATAKAEKAKADTILNLAKAEETQAKTAETVAGIDRDDRDQAIKVAKELSGIIKQ